MIWREVEHFLELLVFGSRELLETIVCSLIQYSPLWKALLYIILFLLTDVKLRCVVSFGLWVVGGLNRGWCGFFEALCCQTQDFQDKLSLFSSAVILGLSSRLSLSGSSEIARCNISSSSK